MRSWTHNHNSIPDDDFKSTYNVFYTKSIVLFWIIINLSAVHFSMTILNATRVAYTIKSFYLQWATKTEQHTRILRRSKVIMIKYYKAINGEWCICVRGTAAQWMIKCEGIYRWNEKQSGILQKHPMLIRFILFYLLCTSF